MKWRRASILGLTLVLFGVGFALTQVTGTNKEEEAIRKTIQFYTEAFNKGDLNAVLGYWSEDGEQIDEDGKVTRGKSALSALFKDVCKPDSGVSIKGSIAAIKVLGGNVALVDGTVEITSPDGADTSGFDAVMVFDAATKRWQINRLRDLPFDDNTGNAASYQHLKGLDWLIGNWTSTEGESNLTFNARWMKNKSYIVVDQTIKMKNVEVLNISMYIGYDSAENKLRSWVFDSQGGRGEADWTRQGNTWFVEASGTTADGLVASSKINWRFIDANTFEWNSTDRQLDGQPRPEIKLTYKRSTPKQ